MQEQRNAPQERKTEIGKRGEDRLSDYQPGSLGDASTESNQSGHVAIGTDRELREGHSNPIQFRSAIAGGIISQLIAAADDQLAALEVEEQRIIQERERLLHQRQQFQVLLNNLNDVMQEDS
jgi:hypothetical protein